MLVSRHVVAAHLMPDGAADCAGATFVRLRSTPISLSKCLTNFLFYAPRVRCCPLWFYWAVRGLYGRVTRQHTLVHGLRGACGPLGSARGRLVWRALKGCLQGTKPGNSTTAADCEPDASVARLRLYAIFFVLKEILTALFFLYLEKF